jgi:hypothetical protein
MAGYSTSAPLLTYPPADDGVSITPSGIADGWSNWVPLTTTTTAWRLAAIIVTPGGFAVGNFFEIEIGTGAVGHETTVAAERGYSGNDSGGSASLTNLLTLTIPADVIPLGSSVSARLRQVSTSVTVWKVAVQYYAMPLPAGETMPVASSGDVNVPSGSRLTLTTNATARVPGAWVEVTSAADGDWMIGHLVCVGPRIMDWAVEFGIGAENAEVVHWTVTSHAQWFAFSNGWQGGPWNILIRPPFLVRDGSRLSVRIKQSLNGADSYALGLTVVKQQVPGVPTAQPMSWLPNPSQAPFLEQVTPPGGPANFTSDGSAPNFSSWVQFIASTSEDIAIAALVSTSDNTGNCLIQIGTGSMGNEVVIANVVAGYGVVASGGAGGRFNMNLPYPIVVPTGTRVSVRMAMEQTVGVFSHYLSLGYIALGGDDPDFESWTTDLVQDWYLSVTAVSGTNAWEDGAWIAVDTDVATDRVLTAFSPPGVVGCEYEIDLGIGDEDEEVVLTTLRGSNIDSSSGCSLIYEVLPIPTTVPAGSRLSIRGRCSLASQFLGIILHYTDAPSPDPAPDEPATVTEAIRWVRRAPHVSDTGQLLIHRLFQLWAQMGVGLSTGQGSEPTVTLRWSDDGGFTWSTPRSMRLGRQGQYKALAREYLLGSSRDRVYEVSGSDPVVTCLVEAFLDVEEAAW